ncbi:hypothetical protein IKE97_01820 [Candidatus Saccharibacteria bacterium]|nr:hypothetical protein [Candidatus Saccharibacteria bacterium]
MNENNQKPEPVNNTKKPENTMRVVIIVLIICAILSVLGVGLGIYGSIQANNAISQLGEYFDEPTETNEFIDEPEYGKPSSIEDINYIGITYNDNKDYIDIVKDEEGSYIEYYAYDSNDEFVGDSVETDVNDIFKYIFDNDLGNFGEDNSLDTISWEIEISSSNGSCYASGSSNPPEWFNTILEKLDAQNKGYKSKTAD